MSAPLEWVLAEVSAQPVALQWSAQPIAPSMVRAEFEWVGTPGMAARIASGLRSLPHVRFEITESSMSPGFDQRISFTPTLGIFRADVDVNGDIMINEQRLRHVIENNISDAVKMSEALDDLLGTAWDAELEPFRVAADGDTVRWVHRAG